MGFNRYTFSNRSKNILGKEIVSKSDASFKIFNAVELGQINFSSHILEEGERLDYLAGKYYGDSSLWWIIAAASGIGYALQVPPGTLIRVPTNPGEAIGVTMQ